MHLTLVTFNYQSADLEAEITSLLCYVVYANFNVRVSFGPCDVFVK